MDSIKLVIWDLDDTFWKGTLSEEGVIPVSENIELVKYLTSRGIINSIASKNEFDKAKNKLIELNVWDYFIFPKIDWNPKGNNIKQIIEWSQLRSENVLFLDDNHLNLAEVEFYNKGIHVQSPDFITKIKHHDAFKGKDDSSYSRLQQYKILENKQLEKILFSDNVKFLEVSEIYLSIIDNLFPIKDRILELINRTNQLNYTKKRLNNSELTALLNNNNYECKAIRVKDKFGEYGIVGFYALHKSKNRLDHFLFSCRSMNIGIEQYIYALLNFPELQTTGDVTTKLNKTDNPHWIQKVTDWTISKNIRSNSTKILLKGACDLRQMAHYLSYQNLDVDTEYNSVNSNNHPVAKAHTEILLQSEHISNQLKTKLSQSLPFIDADIFETKVFSNDYDILIYSLLIDYTQDLYQSKTSGFKVPYESYSDFVNESKDEFIARCKKHEFKLMTGEFYDFFTNEYQFIGQISEDHFLRNLEKIRSKVNKPIIFINGAEVDSPAENKSEYKKARIRHEQMNTTLENFCNKNANTFLLDVRKFVNESDINYSLRHYKRAVYENMASELVNIIELINHQELKRNNYEFHIKRSQKILVSSVKKFAKKILSLTNIILK